MNAEDSHGGTGKVIPLGLKEPQHRFHTQAAKYLPAWLVEQLSKDRTLVTYAEGSTLTLQGSPADVVFWVVSGVLKIYCLVPSGNRVLLRLAGPGEVLGYPALIGPDGGALQPFDVQALSKSTVAVLSRESLFRAIEKLDQPTLIRLFEHFNEPWALVAHRLITFLGYSFRQRLELTLRELVSKFGVQDERGFLLNLKLSHMDFAEMIGSSRPMATVLIGELVAERSLYRLGNHQYLVLFSGSILPQPQLPKLRRDGLAKNGLNYPTSKPPLRPAVSLESYPRADRHRNVVDKRH